jgi:hypothetical protein
MHYIAQRCTRWRLVTLRSPLVYRCERFAVHQYYRCSTFAAQARQKMADHPLGFVRQDANVMFSEHSAATAWHGVFLRVLLQVPPSRRLGGAQVGRNRYTPVPCYKRSCSGQSVCAPEFSFRLSGSGSTVLICCLWRLAPATKRTRWVHACMALFRSPIFPRLCMPLSLLLRCRHDSRNPHTDA